MCIPSTQNYHKPQQPPTTTTTTTGPDPNDRPLNYNRSSEYYHDLGFWVAVDGALRLQRNLPAAALVTFAPPGSFYQDSPITDDVQVGVGVGLGWCGMEEAAGCMGAWVEGVGGCPTAPILTRAPRDDTTRSLLSHPAPASSCLFASYWKWRNNIHTNTRKQTRTHTHVLVSSVAF